jgi:hypothetical protein
MAREGLNIMPVRIFFGLSPFICVFKGLKFFFIRKPEPVPDFFHAAVTAHAYFVIIQHTYLDARTFYNVLVMKHILLIC